MKSKKVLLLIFFGIVLVSSLFFVSAASTIVSPAASSNHSEIINFTCTTTENHAMNATLWYNFLGGVGNVSLATVTNTSTSQTLFENISIDISSLPDATTYNFTCEVKNVTGIISVNSSATGVTVDNTAPVITIDIPAAGWKTSTVTIYANISDALTNFTNTTYFWLQNVSGGLNYSTTALSACAYTGVTSGFNCTGSINIGTLLDGNYTLWINASDTVWVNYTSTAHNNRTQSRTLLGHDETNPTPTVSCSPKTVTTGSSFPCTCSGSDATSGVSSSSGSSTSNSITKTSNTGQFTYTCTVTDNAGNSASSTAKYIVEQTPGSPRTTTTWTTHTITQGVFEQGYTRELGVRNRIKVQIEAEDHFIGVVSISESQATIEISSDLVQVTLAAGEEAKVDVTDDGFYDVYVLLNGITNNKADITIQKIYEEVPEGGTGVETNGEIEGEPSAEEEGGISVWIWIVIAVVIVAIVFWQRKIKKK